MATIGMYRAVDGTLENADLMKLSILNSIGTTIVNQVTVVPEAVGTYSYDVSLLAPGNYTAQWTAIVAGYADDFFSRQFTIDAPVIVEDGVPLAKIERMVARVIGPYHDLTVSATGSSTSQVTVNKLRSTIDIGDYEDMFLLRRGLSRSGAIISNFNSDDRQRLIASYDHVTGALQPDRDWNVSPVVDEWIELHAMDPDNLRVAVQQGIGRCYFWDTIQTSTTTYRAEINLTAVAPWITRPEQVRGVEYGRANYVPQKAIWFDTYRSGPYVFLQTQLANTGFLRIRALRPHSSLVNGEYSGAGPDNDSDILHIDERYARLAGHLACWENYPSQLADLAAQGRQLSMKEVADAFTLRSMALVPNEPEFVQIRFGSDLWAENLQIGNL